MREKLRNGLLLVLPAFVALTGLAQSIPGTAGETLSGKRIVLADAVRGHTAVLVAAFSRDASDGCGAWTKALRSDAALSGVAVYQVAELEQAPGFLRGVIKSGMRKETPVSEQDSFVVLTQDEKLWRSYFGVTADKMPYVVLVDAKGNALWHGHGTAKDLERLVSAARR